jgi:hypothetical protein
MDDTVIDDNGFAGLGFLDLDLGSGNALTGQIQDLVDDENRPLDGILTINNGRVDRSGGFFPGSGPSSSTGFRATADIDGTLTNDIGTTFKVDMELFGEFFGNDDFDDRNLTDVDAAGGATLGVVETVNEGDIITFGVFVATKD